MEKPIAYLPIDRSLALAEGRELPEWADGTVLVADISGFTPLTEMLAQRLGDKRGAEVLTDYLNQVYDGLIAEFSAYGGVVIGFSGDAITCWFAGDEGLRAAAAALAMQGVMGRFANIADAASGEEVKLAMKVALVRGPVRRFVVGDAGYLLLDVMAGRTLDLLSRVEHMALQGEVVVGEETAVSLTPHLIISQWRLDEESGERVAIVTGLNTMPPLSPWPADIDLTDEQIRPWVLTAVYRLLQTGQGVFLAELRQTAALFLRFGGIDYDHDEDAPQKLDSFIRQVEQILQQYDGSLLQLTLGDKGSYLYASFGAPIAHEDDVARAALAALALQTLPQKLPFLSPLQIGVTYGRSRVGAYGSSQRRTYGVLGDGVNLSARLMQAAQPGQILANEVAYKRASAAFVWEQLPAIRVKGKQDAVAVYQLLRQRQRQVGQSLEARFPQPLVGRSSLLTALVGKLRQVAAGQGQLVRLVGAAGMGKSHVAAYVLGQARVMGLEVAVGVCHSMQRTAVYAPWRQIFYTLLGLQDSSEAEVMTVLTDSLTREHPEWLLRLPLLGDLLGLPLPDNATTEAMDSQMRQQSLFSLVVEMVQVWAEKRPLLLIIDNAHWLDEASQSLAQIVAQQAIRTSATMLLLVQRPPQPGQPSLLPEIDKEPDYAQWVLEPMALWEGEMLAQQTLGGRLSPLLVAVVNHVARGNPFFTIELLNAMRGEGQIVEQEGVWETADTLLAVLRRADFVVLRNGQWQLKENSSLGSVQLGIPDSIQGLVLARLDRLSEAHKATLKVGSVIGQTIGLLLLARAHPEQKEVVTVAQEALDLAKEEILQADTATVYTFLHHMTQEVVYDTLLFQQRQQLHRAVAEALVAGGMELGVYGVAQVAYHAFAGEAWSLAFRYNLLAGEQAKQLHATQQAIDFLQKAWQSSRRMGEEETAVLRKQLHVALGELYISTGQYDAANEQLVMALALAQQQQDQEAEGRCYRWFGRLYEQKGAYSEALTWLERGFAVLRGKTLAEEAEQRLLSGLIHVRRGEFDQALAACNRSLQVAEAMGNVAVRARTYNLLGIVAMRSNSGDALGRFQQSLAAYEQLGNVHGQATSHNLIANGYFARGELPLADRHYRQSLDLFVQMGHVYSQVLVNNNLGGIALKQGRWEAALGYYQRAVRQMEQIQGSLWVLGALHLNRGNVLIQQGALTEAEEVLVTAESCFAQVQIQDFLPELYRLFAELYGRRGVWETAVSYGDRSLQLARELEMPREEGHTLRIMGQIALWQQQEEVAHHHFEQSQRLLTAANDAYELAKTQLALARLYVQQRQGAEARRLLLAAEAVFARQEAAFDWQQVRQLLVELDN